MTNTESPFTINDLLDIGRIADACIGNKPVTFLADNGDTYTMTARALCANDSGMFLAGSDDVRDAYVWFSGTFERFIPMAEMLSLLRGQRVALDYRV